MPGDTGALQLYPTLCLMKPFLSYFGNDIAYISVATGFYRVGQGSGALRPQSALRSECLTATAAASTLGLRRMSTGTLCRRQVRPELPRKKVNNAVN